MPRRSRTRTAARSAPAAAPAAPRAPGNGRTSRSAGTGNADASPSSTHPPARAAETVRNRGSALRPRSVPELHPPPGRTGPEKVARDDEGLRGLPDPRVRRSLRPRLPLPAVLRGPRPAPGPLSTGPAAEGRRTGSVRNRDRRQASGYPDDGEPFRRPSPDRPAAEGRPRAIRGRAVTSREHQAGAHATGAPSSTGTAAHAPSRRSTARGRPVDDGAGRRGARRAPSASVRSLRSDSPTRILRASGLVPGHGILPRSWPAPSQRLESRPLHRFRPGSEEGSGLRRQHRRPRPDRRAPPTLGARPAGPPHRPPRRDPGPGPHKTGRPRPPRGPPGPEPAVEAFALAVARRAGCIPGKRPPLPGTEPRRKGSGSSARSSKRTPPCGHPPCGSSMESKVRSRAGRRRRDPAVGRVRPLAVRRF